MGSIPDRPPPSNLNAERALLAAALTNPNAVAGILAAVQQSDFHSYAHAIIFGRIAALHSEGITPDIYTVGMKLSGHDIVDIGGAAYLASLPDAASAIRDWRYYGDIIKDCAKRRAIISVARAACEAACDPTSDVSTVISDIANRANGPPNHHTIQTWWKPQTTAELRANITKPEWLVQRLLVARQPAIIGAGKKGMKTSSMLDLAVSLASGTDFLGWFKIYRKMRVAFISGESGDYTTLETVERIASARNIPVPEITWNFQLPSLSSRSDLADISRAIRDNGIEVFIFDPLYLMLLTGANAEASSASNLFAMGPLLSAVSRACLDAGCTPILIHHAKKAVVNPYQPLELEDLSFAGIQEFARQWLLLSRRQPYEPGSGEHYLWMTAGGSSGQGGLWGIDIDEGQLGDDFTGRKWEVSVASAEDAIRAKQDAKADRADDAAKKRATAGESKILTAMDKADPARQGVSYTALRGLASMGKDNYADAVVRLLAEGIIEYVPDFKTPTGNGGSKPAKGLRRRDLTQTPTPHANPADVLVFEMT